MQTFLPLPSFSASLACLDRLRLGKQRVEAYQILRILQGEQNGWSRHPAVLMWKGYEDALTCYYNEALLLWQARGYQNIKLAPIDAGDYAVVPHWFGDADFHRSHQSNLVRKNPDHYRRFFPDVPDDLPYIWPKGDKYASQTSSLLV